MSLAPEQRALFEKLMALSPDQLNNMGLAPEQLAQIRTLQQLRGNH